MTARLPRELTCRQVVEIVTDYLEGRLPLEQQTHFEQHLAYCTGCTEYLRQVRSTIAAARLPPEPPSPQVERELLKLFRKWEKKS